MGIFFNQKTDVKKKSLNKVSDNIRKSMQVVFHSGQSINKSS